MFIVLEGIDGSGKSEVATKLAEKMGGIVYATPPERYRQLRRQIDTSSSPERHFEFYREAVFAASTEITGLRAEGKVVVCDRYWLTTVVYHRAGGMEVDDSQFLSLIQPDLTVLLYVSPEVQRQREKGRNAAGGSVEGVQMELYRLYWQVLAQRGLPFVTINTDHAKIEQVVDIIMTAWGAVHHDPSR
jgi:dTMP kinase